MVHGAEYKPFDLVPRKPEVKAFDLLEEIPEKSDMIMCLWVLNHFPKEQADRAVQHLMLAGAPYLLLTDRLRYREDQPESLTYLQGLAIEKLVLNDKGDSIRLIRL